MLSDQNKRREATRLPIPVPITLEWVSDSGEPVKEDTVTQDISRKGAAVFSALPLGRGRYLRVSSASFGVTLMASVRNQTRAADGRGRLHLQFLNAEWPLDVV